MERSRPRAGFVVSALLSAVLNRSLQNAVAQRQVIRSPVIGGGQAGQQLAILIARVEDRFALQVAEAPRLTAVYCCERWRTHCRARDTQRDV
ncbi:hypothetical protein [Stenotrophomonas indicatrix]|uniref:hypothetical protein n=1 Tax=Stenotrophomonas indicatrix TaxID=2045451 RepID=UPI0013DD3036|nr:hypothetical protein [Stenotrophomonas indicatrix]MCR8713365.1 hypothetical protein [Stenotrophomonas indicatrix]